MTSFNPVELRLVTAPWADRVPSPAHDALTPDQRRAFLVANPDSYLAVTRSPEDVPADVEPRASAESLLFEGRAALDRLVRDGAFGAIETPRYYAYQLELAGHVQTGLVGGIAIDDYVSGELRVHERVRVEQAEHLAHHFAVVGSQSSPIAVAHRPDPAFGSVLERATAGQPIVVAQGTDGLIQRVWPIAAKDAQAVSDAMAEKPTYIIDGHHRASAGLRFSKVAESASAQQLLCAVFDADQLQNRAFHRWLRHMNLGQLVAAVDGVIEWRDTSLDQIDARADDEIAIYGEGRWITVRLPITVGEDLATRLSGLDPVRLDEQLLRPILGIEPTAASSTLGYRPGSRPIEQLISEIDVEAGVLCVTRPVPIELLLDAADARMVMPPKSTYFEPKVRSGLFLRSIIH